jgi:hypothetical protein
MNPHNFARVPFPFGAPYGQVPFGMPALQQPNSPYQQMPPQFPPQLPLQQQAGGPMHVPTSMFVQGPIGGPQPAASAGPQTAPADTSDRFVVVPSRSAQPESTPVTAGQSSAVGSALETVPPLPAEQREPAVALAMSNSTAVDIDTAAWSSLISSESRLQSGNRLVNLEISKIVATYALDAGRRAVSSRRFAVFVVNDNRNPGGFIRIRHLIHRGAQLALQKIDTISDCFSARIVDVTIIDDDKETSSCVVAVDEAGWMAAWILVLSDSGEIRGRCLLATRFACEEGKTHRVVAFSDSSKNICVAVSHGRSVHLWRLSQFVASDKTGEPVIVNSVDDALRLRFMTQSAQSVPALLIISSIHSMDITDVCPTLCGRAIFTASKDGFVKLHSASSGQTLLSLCPFERLQVSAVYAWGGFKLEDDDMRAKLRTDVGGLVVELPRTLAFVSEMCQVAVVSTKTWCPVQRIRFAPDSSKWIGGDAVRLDNGIAIMIAALGGSSTLLALVAHEQSGAISYAFPLQSVTDLLNVHIVPGRCDIAPPDSNVHVSNAKLSLGAYLLTLQKSGLFLKTLQSALVPSSDLTQSCLSLRDGASAAGECIILEASPAPVPVSPITPAPLAQAPLVSPITAAATAPRNPALQEPLAPAGVPPAPASKSGAPPTSAAQESAHAPSQPLPMSVVPVPPSSSKLSTQPNKAAAKPKASTSVGTTTASPPVISAVASVKNTPAVQPDSDHASTPSGPSSPAISGSPAVSQVPAPRPKKALTVAVPAAPATVKPAAAASSTPPSAPPASPASSTPAPPSSTAVSVDAKTATPAASAAAAALPKPSRQPSGPPVATAESSGFVDGVAPVRDQLASVEKRLVECVDSALGKLLDRERERLLSVLDKVSEGTFKAVTEHATSTTTAVEAAVRKTMVENVVPAVTASLSAAMQPIFGQLSSMLTAHVGEFIGALREHREQTQRVFSGQVEGFERQVAALQNTVGELSQQLVEMQQRLASVSDAADGLGAADGEAGTAGVNVEEVAMQHLRDGRPLQALEMAMNNENEELLVRICEATKEDVLEHNPPTSVQLLGLLSHLSHALGAKTIQLRNGLSWLEQALLVVEWGT